MPNISVTINHVPYTVSCDDGQESKLRDLARYVDAKIDSLKQSLGHVGEAKLLMLASLMIADELAESFAYIDKLEDQKAEALSPTTATIAASKMQGMAATLHSIAIKL